MRSYIFSDITPYSPLELYRGSGGICRLHLQGRRMSQARNQPEAGSEVATETSVDFELCRWLFIPEDGDLQKINNCCWKPIVQVGLTCDLGCCDRK
jgi:hypothetical protein